MDSFLIFSTFAAVMTVCASECSPRQDLLEGNAFYKVTSSHGKVERVLKGTKKALRAAPGEDLSISIEGPKYGSDFNVSKLCVWTRNIEIASATYQGPYPIPKRVKGPNGMETVSSTGPGLYFERVEVEDPDVWSQVCMDGAKGVKSRIQLAFRHSNETMRASAKALVMKACPRRKRYIWNRVSG